MPSGVVPPALGVVRTQSGRSTRWPSCTPQLDEGLLEDELLDIDAPFESAR